MVLAIPYIQSPDAGVMAQEVPRSVSLKVCMVSSLYHPSLGGLGRQAQLLSERLKEEGVDLFVIAREMEVGENAAFSPDVEVIRVRSLFPRKQILEEISLQNILISLLFSREEGTYPDHL